MLVILIWPKSIARGWWHVDCVRMPYRAYLYRSTLLLGRRDCPPLPTPLIKKNERDHSSPFLLMALVWKYCYLVGLWLSSSPQIEKRTAMKKDTRLSQHHFVEAIRQPPTTFGHHPRPALVHVRLY